MENNTYYILITSIEEYTDKLYTMLQILSEQIENYSTSNVENINIRILVCNDNIEKHLKKQLLIKETNYSPKHVFLDVLDNVHSMYAADFVEKHIDPVTTGSDVLNSIKCCCNSL